MRLEEKKDVYARPWASQQRCDLWAHVTTTSTTCFWCGYRCVHGPYSPIKINAATHDFRHDRIAGRAIPMTKGLKDQSLSQGARVMQLHSLVSTQCLRLCAQVVLCAAPSLHRVLPYAVLYFRAQVTRRGYGWAGVESASGAVT
ncbi:hypothetical protein AcW1_005426 [Taiwanofungus camphoratus]|nr:hypothetical protein AcV7_009263 [Antrodia cinnamomea]KAI0956845.1 hypothetical protein AcW1_005426 [Antrodia cinnamomea]